MNAVTRFVAGTMSGAIACAAGLLAATPAAAVDGASSVQFGYTGAAQTWTVPPGVWSATFIVTGASGGRGGGLGAGTDGGRGGQLVATLPVVPGQTHTIVVGGRGKDAVDGGAGGFNGGGAGGFGPGSSDAGGGGGATDVRRGDDALAERVLVAGGGGGSSGSGWVSTSPIPDPSSAGGAGSGGTDATGGATGIFGGGSGGGPALAWTGGLGGSAQPGYWGLTGTSGTGGAGGSGDVSGAGGGGGGGWFGGGGGAAAAYGGTAGGGGGGGAGRAAEWATGVVGSAGVNAGDGSVTIQFLPPEVAPTLTGVPPSGGIGEPYSFAFTTTGSPAPTVTPSSGTLPPGLTLSAAGGLTGTPQQAGTFRFAVQAANGAGSPATLEVSLLIRPRPTIAVADRRIREGNSGTRPLTFLVTLSRASTVPVTVAWSTANGAALEGSDYVRGAGTVTFGPGQTQRTVTVQIRGDRARERTEGFTVRLRNAVDAALADGTAVGGIVNDD